MNLSALSQRRAAFTGTDAEFLAADNATVDTLKPRSVITLTTIRGAIGATYSSAVFGPLKTADPFGYDCLIAGIDSDATETIEKLANISASLPPTEAAALKALVYSSARASGEDADTTQADLDAAARWAALDSRSQAEEARHNAAVEAIQAARFDPTLPVPD